MAASTEQRELELVEKVDFRILMAANDDKKLSDLLSKFLAPLLLKLESQHETVRAKVSRWCRCSFRTESDCFEGHRDNATIGYLSQESRVSAIVPCSSPLKLTIRSVTIPVAALLKQYKSAESELLRSVDTAFIRQGLHRLGRPERRDLLPAALPGIGTANIRHLSTRSLFNTILRILPDVKPPPRGSKEDEAFREEVGLSNPHDARFVSDYFGKVLLLQLGTSATARLQSQLDDDDTAFLTRGSDKDTWSAAPPYGLSLPEIRLKIMDLLASGAFTDQERFLPAIFASGHSDPRISSAGEELLKRSTVSKEDEQLVQNLFMAHARLAPVYRQKILGVLSGSAVSTKFPEQILAVVTRDMEAGRQQIQTEGASSVRGTAGLELRKLHNALFEYINWVAHVGPSQGNFTLGQPLIYKLQEYITDDGWPISTPGKDINADLRSRAYETIGALARAASLNSGGRLSLAGWLYRSLAEDPTAEVVVNIDGALSTLASLFTPPLSFSMEAPLRTLLLTYMTANEGENNIIRSARHAAVKWANRCLRFSDPMARWIDILAIAGRRDERSDVVEEGKKGLDPWTYYSSGIESLELPGWQKLVQAFFREPVSHMNTAEWVAGRDMDIDISSNFFNFRGLTPKAYPLAVRYCERMLLLQAISDFKIEAGWEPRLDNLVRSDKTTRAQIRQYLNGPQRQTTSTAGSLAPNTSYQDLHGLLVASFDGMLQPDPEVVEPCSLAFVTLASLSPSAVIANLAPQVHRLLPLTRSNRKEIRVLAAKAIGILGPHPVNGAEMQAQLRTTLMTTASSWETATGSDMNAAEGAFLALGHLVSRSAFYGRDTVIIDIDGLEKVFPPAKSIANAPRSIQASIYQAVTELWSACVPLYLHSNLEDSQLTALLDDMGVEAKKSNENAIAALGRVSIALSGQVSQHGIGRGHDEDKILNTIMEQLYSLYEIKQAETHFAIGEAIASTIARWDSGAVEVTKDVDTESTGVRPFGKRSGLTTQALEKILTDCKSTKPALLKASGIWLFCIIQHCSELPEIQSKLRDSQGAFMRLLPSRDELVQETASRGLSLVYEKGDESLRGDLVRDLVSSFTGTGPQLKVDDDTELFDAGALPTGDGKSITSYRDIVNLANEVGDQSLIYKFMSLATNAATWTARSAFGRFGLSNILSESEIDPKLYPKLYRYRFDPNKNVQKSMNDIWKALVKDPGAVVETHFDAIMQDLLKSVLGKEWRVCQASCAAIADLVQGQPFERYEKYYEEIWRCSLRVVDHVKSSVREAALKLCFDLSKTLVRRLEEGSTSESTVAMINHALPFLMSDKGIENEVEEVKAFSTITVLDIAKHGGKALRPFLPDMISRLLVLLSTIEHQGLSYYYQRSNEERRETIDKVRSSMVNQSPISAAIENCLRNIDKETMSSLAPALENTIKEAIALPTKIGCSRVLSTLATRHANAFAQYARRFLRLLQKQALDKNNEASAAYAKAGAYIIRVAPEEAKEKFVQHFVDLYLTSEEEARRQKVADVVLALSKISPDHFNSLETQLLPFSYLGSHDADEYVQKALAEVWDKHAGSAMSVTRYLQEITALVNRALDAPQWALKHAGALTVAAMSKAVTGASTLAGQVNIAHLRMLWPVFDKSLVLKTFPDKEKLLDAFPDFVEKGKPMWKDDEKLSGQLKKIAIREAKRNNDAYRIHAFKCLWRFAAAREDLDMLDEISSIAVPFMDELKDENRMDVDNKDGKEDLTRKTAAAGLEAVARGFNPLQMKENPAVVLTKVVATLKPYLANVEFDAIRREVWYKCVLDLMEVAQAGEASGDQPSTADLTWNYFQTLDIEKPEVGTESQRLTRVKAATATAKALKKGALGADSGGEAKVRMKASVQDALARERSLDVQKLLKSLLTEL
jgi:proteasome component ECM29